MLTRALKVELPRRVVVFYLLYSLSAVTWLVTSGVVATKSTIVRGTDAEMLTYLRHAAALTTKELQNNGHKQLQPLMERFSRERALHFSAFVSSDHSYTAHSHRRQIGKRHQVVNGITKRRDDIEVLRYSTDSQTIREYSIPIHTDDESLGRLIVARAETSVGDTLRRLASYSLVALSGPLLLITLGSFTLHRLVSPLAAVDSQLRKAALAPTLSDVGLSLIKSRGPTILGWNRIVREIGEEKAHSGLEQRLNDAVQRLRQGRADDVLNSLADGVAVTDHEGKVTFANQAMAALFASDSLPESLLGNEIQCCLAIGAEDWPDCPLFDPELTARHVVNELERGEGDAKQVLRISRSPIRTADGGGSAGSVWTVRDITQQKLADAMRDQFLDNATHELRTPLANIKAYAETLSMGDSLDVESQKEFCNTINIEATRLARFIDDLLSVSSMEAGSLTLTKQGVDLERLFMEVVAKVKPQMDKKGLEFETIFPAKYPTTKLDKDKVNVALVNLLGNAAKYTPDGGSVRFEVKITDREIRLEVEDSGVGIAEEELPRIFEKFFRSANPSVQEITGTGLGLSMAHEVIKLHGGEMTVQSTLGEGTTFITTLPLE